MRAYILYAVLAGVAWGVGGYFEKIGLQAMRLPPIVGITVRTLVALVILGLVSIPEWKAVSAHAPTRYWVMIAVGGGLVAGSFGMWSFYSALARSENLGITLATAFAFAPLAGTVLGLVRRDQQIDLKIGIGLAAVILGIVMLQLSSKHPK
jgi:transporter family protein